MKHLKAFEEMGLNKLNLFSFLKNKGLSKYLVTYNITNYEANKEDWKQGQYTREWNSNNYEYLITANSKEEAKDKFSEIWNKKVSSFEPKPKLNILAVDLIDDKETMGSFKNKIHFY